MRIAHIVCTYPPYYGGMGGVVFEMASGLSGLGHTVEVFTPDYYTDTEIRPEGAPTAVTHSPLLQEKIDFAKRLKPSLSYGNAARLPTIGRELASFDLVHLHYPFFGTAGLIRQFKKTHPEIPLVITYHMDTRGPGWKGLVFKWYAQFWLPRMLAAADQLQVSSFDYLEHSAAQGHFQKQKEKWLELPFGVDIDRFIPKKPSLALMDQLSLQRDIPVLLFVGGMDAAHYFKGISILLRAMYILKKNRISIQLVLVGDGELRVQFAHEARALGIDAIVHFVGRISSDELPSYYQLADLCVLPSTHEGEAFGMVLLEAMASGVPVIASDLPGVRMLARDGGIVVPPNDPQSLAAAITEFFSSENDRDSFAKQAREVVEKKYAWKSIVKRLSNEYEKLLMKN